MLFNLIELIIGFTILIKGADFFVEGSSSLAKNLKIPSIIIGLTIVAFGTSAPELAVSIQSLLTGNGEIVLGNVFGSNIINILLIIGISSLLHPLTVKNNTVKKELPILLLMTTLLIILLNDSYFGNVTNSFSKQDSIIILLSFSVFLYYLFSVIKNGIIDNKEIEIKYNIPKSIFLIFIGILSIIFGSRSVVKSASNIAFIIGVSERIISLTIIALGTSLPELVTSVLATCKGEYDIAIGNIVGSNLFNIGIVLSLPVALIGNIEEISFNTLDLSTLFISALLLFIFSFNDKKISKKEGIVFLVLFISYYYILLI